MIYSRTASISEWLRRKRHWSTMRLQFRSGFKAGKAGRRYEPYPTRGFNAGYWNGFVEGRARRKQPRP